MRDNNRKCCEYNNQMYLHCEYVCPCVCSDSIIGGGVIIDLHPADQFSHQLLHSVRAQPSHLQDAFMVHAVQILITLHHL